MKAKPRPVSPQLVFGIICVAVGTFSWVVWVIGGEGFWSIGVPASVSLVAGAYIVISQLRKGKTDRDV